MGKIIQLPALLANQIAAWEVVERPISVVKELVENSLDAGCDSIKIELENGWIDLIVVSDTGDWIEKDDLALITKKHTTSKITSLEDLQKVMTFWFRWEAIASIASVSDLEIISKHTDSIHGYSLKNETISQSPIDSGTKVIVHNLFSKTPARLNYLKKPRTEYLKIQEFIQKMALAYPEIEISLFHDDKKTLHFLSRQTLRGRIYEIYWDELVDNLLELKHEFAGITIHGMISNPCISFPNKNRQSIFVNNRSIMSPLIQKSISDAYNRFIAHGTFPCYIVFVELDPK